MKKNLSYYLGLNYPKVIRKDTDDDGNEYYEAEIPDLPGCGSWGKTEEEALQRLDEAKKAYLEVSLDKNLPIPEPVSEDEFSGKFLLRIPAKLHMQLTRAARKEDLSLNQYIRIILEKHLELHDLLEKVQELSDKLEALETATTVEVSRTSYITNSGSSWLFGGREYVPAGETTVYRKSGASL